MLVALVPFSVELALEASVDPVVVVPVVPVVEELLIVDDMPSSKSGEQRSPAAVDMVDIVDIGQGQSVAGDQSSILQLPTIRHSDKY